MDEIPWYDPAHWPWWLRYPAGVALIVTAALGMISVTTSPVRGAEWQSVLAGAVIAIGATGYALRLMYEAALASVAALVVGGVVYAIAGLPTSLAVVLGAMIIGGAVRSRDE